MHAAQDAALATTFDPVVSTSNRPDAGAFRATAGTGKVRERVSMSFVRNSGTWQCEGVTLLSDQFAQTRLSSLQVADFLSRRTLVACGTGMASWQIYHRPFRECPNTL